MRTAWAATGLLLLFASAASAQSSTANGATATQPAAPAPAERLICRRVEESGSLARRPRRCFTRAQWDRLAEDSRNSGSTAMSGSASGN